MLRKFVLFVLLIFLVTLPSLALATVPVDDDNAAGLIGIWEGSDALGGIQVKFTSNHWMILSHPGADLLEEVGRFTVDKGSITVLFEDNATQTYRCLLTGDAMILTDESLQYSVSVTRISREDAVDDPISVLGTWGGAAFGTYGEVTFQRQGKITATVPAQDIISKEGTYSIDSQSIRITWGDDPAICIAAFILSDNRLYLFEGTSVESLERLPGYLTRTEIHEAITAPVDAALLGTWGGMQNDDYVEWSFCGNGTFRRFVPQDESLSYEGTYTTAAGQLTLNSGEDTLQGSYVVESDVLGIHFNSEDSFGYRLKSGPLQRIAYTGQ